MKTGRNQPCPCGSGLKYKQCCLNKSGGMSLQMKMVMGLVSVIILVAAGMALMQVISSARNPDGAAPVKRVWSEEHQHWHYQ